MSYKTNEKSKISKFILTFIACITMVSLIPAIPANASALPMEESTNTTNNLEEIDYFNKGFNTGYSAGYTSGYTAGTHNHANHANHVNHENTNKNNAGENMTNAGIISYSDHSNNSGTAVNTDYNYNNQDKIYIDDNNNTAKKSPLGIHYTGNNYPLNIYKNPDDHRVTDNRTMTTKYQGYRSNVKNVDETSENTLNNNRFTTLPYRTVTIPERTYRTSRTYETPGINGIAYGNYKSLANNPPYETAKNYVNKLDNKDENVNTSVTRSTVKKSVDNTNINSNEVKAKTTVVKPARTAKIERVTRNTAAANKTAVKSNAVKSNTIAKTTTPAVKKNTAVNTTKTVNTAARNTNTATKNIPVVAPKTVKTTVNKTRAAAPVVTTPKTTAKTAAFDNTPVVKTTDYNDNNINKNTSNYRSHNYINDGYDRYNNRNNNNMNRANGLNDNRIGATEPVVDSNVRRNPVPATTAKPIRPAAPTRKTVTRAATTKEKQPITENTTNTTVRNHGFFRNTTNRYRDTVSETKNATITFIVLLSAIVALLALSIYAIMRRPRHERISDNDISNRRR